MEEQLISFDTAKLAKEKGFLEDCRNSFTWYNTVKPMPCSTFRDWNSFDKDWFSAPTQSLLQKWLREVYHIEVNAIPTGLKLSRRYLPRFWFSGYEYNGADFVTYEEALEEGLIRALKLIKID